VPDSIMQHYLHTCAVKMYTVSNFTRSARSAIYISH